MVFRIYSIFFGKLCEPKAKLIYLRASYFRFEGGEANHGPSFVRSHTVFLLELSNGDY
jgi:hypothetical protein